VGRGLPGDGDGENQSQKKDDFAGHGLCHSFRVRMRP
jgi:hypothetical protein